MSPKKNQITVCICPFKRPKLLSSLLEKLQHQDTDNLFTYSIVIVDNDAEKSATNVVRGFKKNSSINIDYFNVPEKSFSLARNTAIKNAAGNYVALIDDDETPVSDWLINHYRTIKKYDTVAVLGPVVPDFEIKPPKWIVKGKLSNRKRFPTGTYLDLINTRTGNVLLKKDIFDDESNYFDLSFGNLGGEDVDFFNRLKNKNYKFVWCDEAI
ncbi:MAG: glycosyltransferase, partial [Spirochaetes bacterium]|nr:glycosyltransferase [Spirochaetota bacterium]